MDMYYIFYNVMIYLHHNTYSLSYGGQGRSLTFIYDIATAALIKLPAHGDGIGLDTYIIPMTNKGSQLSYPSRLAR
jgi:hypothetical protein